METISEPEVAAPVLSVPAPAPVTALVLAPRWRFGRRGLAKQAVAACAQRWRPRVKRLLVAGQGAAAPMLREAGLGEILIVPESESLMSTLACALDACPSEPLLLLDAEAEIPRETLDLMLACLDEAAAVAAVIDRRRGLLAYPLLCRHAIRPLLTTLLHRGQTSLLDLLRLPCARLVTPD